MSEAKRRQAIGARVALREVADAPYPALRHSKVSDWTRLLGWSDALGENLRTIKDASTSRDGTELFKFVSDIQVRPYRHEFGSCEYRDDPLPIAMTGYS